MQQNQSSRVYSNSSTSFRIAIPLLFVFCLLFSSCVPKNKGSTRIKVVASMPVIYDWTRNLIDESTNTKFFLNLIIKNGLNYHNQTPGVTEENLVATADLLIYIGGTSEKWIDEVVQKTQAANPKRLVLKLSDYIQGQTPAGFDEHSVLSPKNADICCKKITEYICTLDSENTESYKNYSAKYSQLLSILDNTLELQAQKAQSRTFIICDRMPFKYLFNEYGFNYIALDNNCPATQNFKPELETIKQFGASIDSLGANAVYVFEDSDKKLAKQVIANSKNPKCDTFVFDSMESLTLSQLFSGKNYINIMQNNLTLLLPN